MHNLFLLRQNKNVNNCNWVCDLRLKMTLKLGRWVLLAKFEVIELYNYVLIFTCNNAIKKIEIIVYEMNLVLRYRSIYRVSRTSREQRSSNAFDNKLCHCNCYNSYQRFLCERNWIVLRYSIIDIFNLKLKCDASINALQHKLVLPVTCPLRTCCDVSPIH